MLFAHTFSFGFLISTVAAIYLEVDAIGGNETSPLQYGIMFEDISHSGDGGLYAELIQNRAFQGTNSSDPWTSIGPANLSVVTSAPISASLSNSLLIQSDPGLQIGVANPGWWGIKVKPQTYVGSFWALGVQSSIYTVTLQSALTGEVWACANLSGVSDGNAWTQYNFTLTPEVAAPDTNNVFTIEWTSDSSLQLQLISLFPPTYNNRPNGMRVDLMKHLKALKPGFIRMPGGNNIEGNASPNFWKWNQTIGPLLNRPGRQGTWGYYNTDGLGLIEYLHWARDLEAEPILGVWSGFYLDGEVIPEESLQPYIQDTLDELEFLMGNISTPYGALRAELGYPHPFSIKYVEVGNEDNLNGGLSSYSSYRFSMFYSAIKAVYPDMNVIASTIDVTPQIGDAAGDYHGYTRPDQFVQEFNYFDDFSSLHKTLIGEYANIQDNIKGGGGADFSQPNRMWASWIGTVAEAVFLLGIERNTNYIIGSSYAPLLANLNDFQSTLFSNTRTTEVLPTTSDAEFGPAYWVAGVNNEINKYVMKAAIYNATEPVSFHVKFGNGSGKVATLTVLTAPDPYSENVLDGTNQVETTVSTIHASKGAFRFSLPNYSVALLTSDIR